MEMVSKENRESDRGQWCILLSLSLREGMCCRGEAHMCYGMEHCTQMWDERGGSRRWCGEFLKQREGRQTIRDLV